MSRFNKYLNELSSEYGAGITFVDVDDTIFKTFAKIYVIFNGVVVKKLSNQEFNTYTLKDGEEFDFREFRDAKTFRKTSIPIDKTIKRIKRMFLNIKKRDSKIILLTARSDFDDKNEFLNTFRDYGIPIDNMYVERAGNKEGIIAELKKKIILKYLSTGLYRRVRLIDDDMANIKGFLSIEKSIPNDIINKVKEKYGINKKENIPVIEFFGLLVQANGSLKRIK